eukprot:TRINITY_DN5765_c0_g1_i1.p2 TRINITY_DN5765_c0_g1~~TRINITY_DN5765_c0_g1_i1.p2  ORF type:complete len:108 (+),score=22.71 TRINITY_DN5765_c0_g1_i1:339-662(+)
MHVYQQHCRWRSQPFCSSLSVTPVIGYLPNLDLSKLKMNDAETEEIFTVPIAELLDREKLSFQEYGERGTLPIFKARHPIWGLTGYILYNFLRDVMHAPFPKDLKKR